MPTVYLIAVVVSDSPNEVFQFSDQRFSTSNEHSPGVDVKRIACLVLSIAYSFDTALLKHQKFLVRVINGEITVIGSDFEFPNQILSDPTRGKRCEPTTRKGDQYRNVVKTMWTINASCDDLAGAFF